MCGALSLVSDTAERSRSEAPVGDDIQPTVNGHPAPSVILVVEDEMLVRLGVTDYLRDGGYHVLEASTAEEAQEILCAGELVEILFSDINLGPGIDGFELATWTREHHRDIRIVLTSGVARMAKSAIDLCDGPLLTKPYSYEALARHFSRLLGDFVKRGV